MEHEAVLFVRVSAAGVRADKAVPGGPERMFRWQRLGVSDVQIRGVEPVFPERGEQRLLVHGRAAADVVKPGAGLAASEAGGVEIAERGIVFRQDVHDVIRLAEHLVGGFLGDHFDAFVPADRAAHADKPHVQRAQDFDQPARDGAEAVEEHDLAVEQHGGGADFVVKPGPGAELVGAGLRQLPGEREDHGGEVLGARFVEDVRTGRQRRAAAPQRLAQVVPVVAGVTGRGEVRPTDPGVFHQRLRIRLAENDVRLRDGGVRSGNVENGGRQLLGPDELVVRGAVAQQFLGGFRKNGVAPDPQGGGRVGHRRWVISAGARARHAELPAAKSGAPGHGQSPLPATTGWPARSRGFQPKNAQAAAPASTATVTPTTPGHCARCQAGAGSSAPNPPPR